MIGIAARVHAKLQQDGLPVVGVSIGSEADRATWRASYTAAVTAAQIAQGQTTLATMDVNDATLLDTIANTDATADYDTDKKIRAVAQALWECIPAPTMTKLQLRARVIAILKTL